MNDVPKNISELDNDRILFVNMRTGKVFFDCHPAEARTAIKAIKNIRESNEIADIKKKVGRLKYLINEDQSQFEIIVSTYSGELTVSLLSTLMSNSEKEDYLVDTIVVGPKMYATFRAFGKQLVETYTKEEYIMAGIFAYMWGFDIVVDSLLEEDCIVLASHQKTITVRKEGSIESERKTLETPFFRKYHISL